MQEKQPKPKNKINKSQLYPRKPNHRKCCIEEKGEEDKWRGGEVPSIDDNCGGGVPNYAWKMLPNCNRSCKKNSS